MLDSVTLKDLPIGSVRGFHGYPQHPYAHPERPWWRKARHVSRLRFDDCWQRSDLALREGADLAAYDAARPLSCPPPLCGQVWVLPPGCCSDEEHLHLLVTCVRGDRPIWDDPLPEHLDEWPIPGAVLADGPHAPWAPMGTT